MKKKEKCNYFCPMQIGRFLKNMFVYLFVFVATNSSAQTTPSLPMITASSPKATMMNRYGEYPVSLYTGLVDVTIPIFEINVNGIKVPVEFKYHASGLKFDDMPMELGYGWTLIAGGTASHSVRGTPQWRSPSDGYAKADPYVWTQEISSIALFQNTTYTTPDNDQSRLVYINNGAKYPFPLSTLSASKYSDSEYDLYSYNFLNYIGQLYLLGDSQIAVPANGFHNLSFLGADLKIIDKEGITYTLTTMESDSYGFNEVWYLTKIISANKADTIVFNYTSYNSSSSHLDKPVIDQCLEWKDTENYLGGNYWHLEYHNVTGNGKTIKPFSPPRLNFIQYRGGKIEFVYPGTGTYVNLTEIKIYDHQNILNKTVTLNKTANGDWLNGVAFKDNANNIQQTYAFEYNPMTNTSSTGIDYWGYYNGKTVGSYYIPKFTIPHMTNAGTYENITLLGTNRTADSAYMQCGILNKVVFPTKGYTTFNYEAHKADNQIYGGLRIKEILSYNPDGTLTEKKWYKYGEGESGNGRPVRYINYASPNISDFYREFLIVENGGSASNLSSSIYQQHHFKYFYPFPLTSYFSSGSSVVYPEVAEYSGTGSIANGKTVYTYTDTQNETRPTYRAYSQPQPFKSYEWKNGLLKNKTVYNSSGQPIYSLANIYDYLSTSETLNLGVSQYADIVNVDPPNNRPDTGQTTHQFSAEEIKNNLGSTHSGIVPFAQAIGGSLFDYCNYYITTGLPVVKSSTETQDGISKTTFYDYNHLGLPTKVKAIDSRGDSISTRYKYPGDFNTAPYTSMADNHILSPVIQQEQYKNTSFLSKTVNEYKHWGNGIYEPEIIQFQASASDALTDRITFHNRDVRGNPQYISKDGNDKVVYIWGYNYLYPIAEIKNATYAEVQAAMNYDDTQMAFVSSRSTPSVDDWNVINGLRQTLPQALVTTYTYKPLVGRLTETDPRGQTVSYTYDDYGRLTSIKDPNDQALSNYSYKYMVLPMQIDVPVEESYTLFSGASTRSFTASVINHTGTLTYDWYLRNASGAIESSKLNTTNKFSVDLFELNTSALQFAGKATMTLTCIAKDNTTGETVQTTETFHVNLATEFWNVRPSGFPSGPYFFWADIYCANEGTIRFNIDIQKRYSNAYVQIRFTDGIYETIEADNYQGTREISYSRGRHQVFINIDLPDGVDFSQSGIFAKLTIEQVPEGNVKGNNLELTSTVVVNGN